MHMLERLSDPSRTPLIGTWVKIPALETTELLARAGFDFLVADMEHSPMTLEAVYRMTTLAQALGLHVLVRVPDRSGSHIQRVLDLGADGILVPRVGSAEQAAAAISGMRFPPHGDRGLGTTSRAGAWGLDTTADYLEHGERDILRIPQLEDPGALDEAAAILDTPGLNAVFLGPGDLSLATGLPPGSPELTRMADGLLREAAARSLPCGTAVRDADAAARAAARGYSFVMVGNDAHLFGQAARQLCGDTRAGVRTARGH
ncbi:HpcH/HpaI aldolase family protein [Streptomyces tagetis]|uniref:2,4-dihydroxyhept-2-ene-1,7-dioic acid aldolase n=1 Tax=Streptomyces tagetis TaxID=2820809 RepID=A0A940XFJ1_9ACTN|nr:aldolase/citrate lyase family protein [Streptomyces sp. RG38]MBQ0826537.1 2,4-dihydroxyhept-2-ene-1,7-dioic acid aldolase [Streptomyces sp. RG38]